MTNEDIPPWLEIARREIGVKEKFGDAENSRILQYFGATRYHAKKDEIPWCSAFMCWVMEAAGIASTRSASASSWATWGDQCMARPGAVVVFGKADPDAGGTGHVALFERWNDDKTAMYVLGGNQRNSVCVAERPVSRVVAVRWPHLP